MANDAWIGTDPVAVDAQVWAPPTAGGPGTIQLFAPDAVAEGGVVTLAVLRLTAPDATAEGGTVYRAATFVFPTVYADTAYMYENIGFQNNPQFEAETYMYENIGFLVVAVNSDTDYMYENVGFSLPWTSTWYGWGVPANSDYTAMDCWTYMYENVTV